MPSFVHSGRLPKAITMTQDSAPLKKVSQIVNLLLSEAQGTVAPSAPFAPCRTMSHHVAPSCHISHRLAPSRTISHHLAPALTLAYFSNFHSRRGRRKTAQTAQDGARRRKTVQDGADGTRWRRQRADKPTTLAERSERFRMEIL